MKEDLTTLSCFALVLLILIGVFWLEFAKYEECRRVHPRWYCLMQK